MVTRPELLAGFAEDFGYFDLLRRISRAAAAGFAVLEVIEAEGLIGNAAASGNICATTLAN